jgi:hypothetical protein
MVYLEIDSMGRPKILLEGPSVFHKKKTAYIQVYKTSFVHKGCPIAFAKVVRKTKKKYQNDELAGVVVFHRPK